MAAYTDEAIAEAAGLVTELYRIVDRLQHLFPGRRFTPDGHLVGSIGEVLAAYLYDIELTAMSTEGCDARSQFAPSIEIKTTQGDSVAFRCKPTHLLVFKLSRAGAVDEVYNGPGALPWALLSQKPVPSNGQRALSLATLRELQRQVPPDQRLPRRGDETSRRSHKEET